MGVQRVRTHPRRKVMFRRICLNLALLAAVLACAGASSAKAGGCYRGGGGYYGGGGYHGGYPSYRSARYYHGGHGGYYRPSYHRSHYHGGYRSGVSFSFGF